MSESSARTGRFPPPWSAHFNEDAYWVQDANGSKFAFTYYRDAALVGTDNSVRLSRDEARRIVANIAKLPDLLKAEKKRGIP
jgi:hypothetical protein